MLHLIFCFLHATQAVIFRVISGGFRSPNCSRSAMIAGAEGEPSIAYQSRPVVFRMWARCCLFEQMAPSCQLMVGISTLSLSAPGRIVCYD